MCLTFYFIVKERYSINKVDNQIKASKVLLVGEGAPRELAIEEARDLADERDLNLVVVSDKEIPVCRILDYSKFLYEKQKKEKSSKKGKKVVLKEIKMSPNIAEHDMQIKAKTASKILSEGDKLRVSMMFKGRSVVYAGDGITKVQKFLEMLDFKYRVDTSPTLTGNIVFAVVSPANK